MDKNEMRMREGDRLFDFSMCITIFNRYAHVDTKISTSPTGCGIMVSPIEEIPSIEKKFILNHGWMQVGKGWLLDC